MQSSTSQPVAAISGAASGIGLALATLYAQRGVRVIAGYYPADPHDPAIAAAQVEAAGGGRPVAATGCGLNALGR